MPANPCPGKEMLDWLASKIGVLIAVGVLTTFALGLFAWQHSEMVDREGQAVTDRIANTLDALAGLDAATLLNVSYGSGADQLPMTIGGDGYTVNISSDTVILTCGDRQWSSHLVERVVPHALDNRSMNLTEAEALDELAWSGPQPSGEPFTIERAGIEVSGEARYATVVRWDT